MCTIYIISPEKTRLAFFFKLKLKSGFIWFHCSIHSNNVTKKKNFIQNFRIAIGTLKY